MPNYISLKGSVGKGGDNHRWDVFKVQYDLSVLIADHKFVVGTPIFPHGICDKATIEAIILFQNRYGLHPVTGRIDPQSLSAARLYEERGYANDKIPEWKYQSSTGWSISASGFGSGISSGRMTLYVSDVNNSSNNFRVVCSGGQVSFGVGLSPADFGGGFERSTTNHTAAGTRIRRMPKGSDPLVPADFEGVVLMDAASVTAGSTDPTLSLPNKGTVGQVTTFSGTYWPMVVATAISQFAGATSPTGSALILVRRQLDKLARTRGWISGTSSSHSTDPASIEGAVAVYKSRVELG